MKLGRKLIVAAMALLVACAALAGRGDSAAPKTYLLFDGSNAADSTERASRWIPIQGASRVLIRTWSAGADADTDFADTVNTWKTLLSDSVSFIAVDSLGTIVTARSTIPRSTTTHGEPYPMCADSVVITNVAADSVKMVAVATPVQGVAKPVRGSVTGSGRYTLILPTDVGGAVPATGAQNFGPTGVFGPQYLRIRITPFTRMTTAGFSSTQGRRTRGLNRLRMVAYIYGP